MKSNHPFLSALLITLSLLISDSSYSQMYWNQSCSFAGNSNSYIRVQNSSSIDLTGSFTIEAWVNPSTLSGLSKGIVAKGGSLGTFLKYSLRLNTSGRFSVITNGSPRLTSKTNTPVRINEWNHVSVTYNSSTNLFSIYLNGILDTTAVIAGAAPGTNSDSLFIGISGTATPFSGQLDEVRIWNRELSSAEVSRYMRTSLGTSSGFYTGLVLSMTFQRLSNISPFTADDLSGSGNNGITRNVTAKDQTYQPYNTIDKNESAEFDGDGDYLAGKDSASVFPTDILTFECWYYPRDANLSTLIRKANGAGTAFSVLVSSTSIRVIVNDQVRILFVGSVLNQWTHMAVMYTASTGEIEIYQNSKFRHIFINSPANIAQTGDSLYIGGSAGSTECFNGFIDEVRITGRKINDSELDFRIYRSLEASDDTEPTVTNVSYNLDGNTYDNGEDNGPVLYFRNEGRFSHPSQISGQPRSPVLNTESEDYYKAFYFNTASLRIPATGTEGTIESTQQTYLDYTISDIDIFVLLDHTNISNLVISIYKVSSPDSLIIFDGNTTNSSDNNLALLFDDQSDSSLINNRYSSYCTSIKPLNSMNSYFSGKNTKGSWGIRIRDRTGGDIGFLYSWGIRFNNMTAPENNFIFTALMQGFYNPESNILIQDTIRVNLRDTAAPYGVLSTSKAYCNTTGQVLLSFGNISYLRNYYLQVIHRNTIETWASSTVQFNKFFLGNYRFDVTDTSVLGSNELIVETSPVRYGMYSGDVNQDGSIDLNDVLSVYNAATIFSSGYITDDVTGDDLADLNDILIAYNNSAAFVAAVRP